MEKLLRSRASMRGWATREVNKLTKILEDESLVQVQSLKFQLSELEHRIINVDKVQEEIEAIEDVTRLEATIDEAYTFRERIVEIKLQALTKVSALEQQAADNIHDRPTSTSSESHTRLPRLEIKKFAGDITQWQTFWDQFRAAVDQTTLPKVNKFTYLKNLLEGEALNSIVGLALTDLNYDLAIKSLQDRFGRPERIIFSHIQALLVMETGLGADARSSKASDLWRIRDELNAHVRSLEALGVDGEKYGVILTPLILSRLPIEIRLEWARSGIGKESDLCYLLEFLKLEIERRERSEGFSATTTGGGRQHNSEGFSATTTGGGRQQNSEGFSATTTGGGRQQNYEGFSAKTTGGGQQRGGTLSAMASTSSSWTRKQKQYQCIFCNKENHKSWQCRKLNEMSYDDKLNAVKNSHACFKCFNTSHYAAKCNFKCRRCDGSHHDSLCRKEMVNRTPTEARNVKAITISQSSASMVHTVLQTAKVKVKGSTGECTLTMMFDTGSDNTYVSSDAVKKVGPEWLTSKSIAFAAFGEGKPSNNQERNIYKVHVANKFGGWEGINCIEVKSICAPMVRSKIPQSILNSVSHLGLADSYEEDKPITVDILIGLDYYWQLMGQRIHSLTEGLVVQDTAFGWVLSGRWDDCNIGQNVPTQLSHQMLCMSDVPKSTMDKFWDLEMIGVKQPTNELPDDSVLRSFNDNIRLVEGRYEVKLPWKEGMKEQLLDNKHMAKVRLDSLQKRLVKDDKLGESYDAVLSEMESLGIIAEVPVEETGADTVYYLPHHPVVKETSLTTKVRPVFDASAKGINGLSLNDCMETGPPLLPGLVDILIRFRRWQIGLSSDITKAFLQVKVHEDDQDVHRFMWKVQDTIRIMKFLRVPFGNSSSPFLLNATIRYHLSNYPDCIPITELRDNMYVDDWLSGADHYEDAILLFKQANDIMRQGKFQLASWNSNDANVTDRFFHEFGSKHLDRESVKILGLKWNKPSDSFGFAVKGVPHGLVATKRVVLSILARLYDPLGFLTPFTMLVKILLQDIWLLNLDWDEQTPEVIQQKFLKWVGGLDLVRNWQIPRCYTSKTLWSEIKDVEVHGFGDASERGYGSVVYIRIPNSDGFEIAFVTSRARVAPVKKVSLPRLELLGALLTARLIVFVRDVLRLKHVVCRAWTDSTVALGWIHGEPSRWETFVRNRVTEIQQLTEKEAWAHCPGNQNPADLLTRGVSAGELISASIWLSGPEWLSRKINLVKDSVSLDKVEPFLKSDMKSAMLVETRPHNDRLFDVHRWGTLGRAVRVVAWVNRFIGKLKGRRDYSDNLSREELAKGKVCLIRQEQEVSFGQEREALKGGKPISGSSPLFKLKPFVGDCGLLRVRGRLQQSSLSYDEKHPVIVPKGHFATLLIRSCHVRLQHAGVDTVVNSLRNNYWIIGSRRLTKAMKKGCISCQRVDAQACNQTDAPLPELRVHQAPPFTVTGLDYAGPLFCVDYPNVKFYILLFTCAVVRAIHLELTESLSQRDCVLALRRFTARRGMPTVIYSDNAMTFKGAEKELLTLFGEEGPKWKYIAPRSPWWGGWWERLVRSVKGALKKSLGSRCLTRTELETSLQEVEACVNSRPLTSVRDEVDDPSALTPSHFLIGRAAGFQNRISELEIEINREDLSERELVRQRRLELFWEVWTKEYLRNLPPAINKFKSKGNVGLGSLVLIREDNVPRMKWPLGLIVKEFPGKDGLARCFELKTARGNLVRAIQRLHDLELEGGSVPLPQIGNPQGRARITPAPQRVSRTVTRSGRVVKSIKKLDL